MANRRQFLWQSIASIAAEHSKAIITDTTAIIIVAVAAATAVSVVSDKSVCKTNVEIKGH